MRSFIKSFLFFSFPLLLFILSFIALPNIRPLSAQMTEAGSLIQSSQGQYPNVFGKCSEFESKKECDLGCSPLKNNNISYKCKWMSVEQKCVESSNVCGNDGIVSGPCDDSRTNKVKSCDDPAAQKGKAPRSCCVPGNTSTGYYPTGQQFGYCSGVGPRWTICEEGYECYPNRGCFPATPTKNPKITPTPTKNPTPPPPLRCESMKVFLNGKNITNNLGIIKPGDKVTFSAFIKKTKRKVNNMTFQLIKDNIVIERKTVPVVLVNQQWNAKYVKVIDSYGNYRVRVQSVK